MQWDVGGLRQLCKSEEEDLFGPSTTILLTTLFKVRKNCRIQILISELSWLAHEVEFVLVDLCRSR